MKTLITGFMTMALCAGALAQSEQISFKSESIAEGLYMLTGEGGFAGGNILISTGDDGTVMIDDSMPPLLDKLNTAIEGLTGGEVEFLINTHLHGDHTGNNASFAKTGARIVGHENVRQRMQAQDDKSAADLPVITFTEEITFYLNDQPARVFHVPRAHTDGDAVIHFTDLNVIHTGDVLFNGRFPFIDIDSGGSVQGYLDAQQVILDIANDKTVIVPGHGPIANREDVATARQVLLESRERVAALLIDGHSESDILEKNPLADFSEKWSWGFITTEKMTRTLYRDLQMHGDGKHDHHHHH